MEDDYIARKEGPVTINCILLQILFSGFGG
jgi:hypothetical protein